MTILAVHFIKNFKHSTSCGACTQHNILLISFRNFVNASTPKFLNIGDRVHYNIYGLNELRSEFV